MPFDEYPTNKKGYHMQLLIPIIKRGSIGLRVIGIKIKCMFMIVMVESLIDWSPIFAKHYRVPDFK